MDLNEVLRKNLVVVNEGSGVVITSSEDENLFWVLTAKHVVSNREGILSTTVEDVLKRFGPVEVNLDDIWLHPDDSVDAAVIRVPFSSSQCFPPIRLLFPTDNPKGRFIQVVGYPKIRRSGGTFQLRRDDLKIKGSTGNNRRTWEAEVSGNATKQEMNGVSGGGVFVIKENGEVWLMGIQSRMTSTEEELGRIEFMPIEEFKRCFSDESLNHIFHIVGQKEIPNLDARLFGNLALFDADTVDLSKRQIENGELESAIIALENHKKHLWEQSSKEIQYKLLVNLAVAHFKFGTKEGSETGARYLTQLEGYADIKDGALGNAALGYAHLGNYEKALKLANDGKRVRDSQENAWLAEIFSYRNHSQLASALKKLPNKLKESSYFLSNVGTAYYRLGDRNAAIIWLRESLEKCRNNMEAIQIKLFLGSTLIERNAKPSDFMLGQFTQAAVLEAKEGVELLEEVWKQWRGTSWAKIGKSVLQNLSIGKKILGDFVGALAADQECFELEEADGHAKFRYGISLWENGRPHEASNVIESIQGTQFETPEVLLVLSEINLSRGRGDLSITDLEALIEEMPAELSGQKQLHPYILLFKCYLQTDKLNKARETLDKFKEIAPGDINTYVLRGDLAKHDGNTDEALESYLEAAKLVNNETSYVVISVLGNRLFNLGEFIMAAEVYKLVVNPLVPSEINQKFIQSLYNSDNKIQALEICRGLEDRLGKGEFLTSIEANLYEQAGNLAGAIIVCSDFLSIDPNTLEIALYLSYLYIRSGELEQAKIQFSQIPLNKIDSAPSRVRLNFAEQAVELGREEEGMEVFFDIWYSERDSEIFSDRFLQNFLKVTTDQNEPLSFSQNSKVLKGYVSILKEISTAEEIPVLLTDGPQKIQTDFGYECGTESDWGEVLIGERRGSRIELDFGSSKRELEIVEIQHKYVWAFQSILCAQVANPSEGGSLRVIDLGETESGAPNIQKFRDLIDDQNQRIKIVYDSYRQNRIPISALAGMTGQSVLQTMDFLSHSKGLSITAVHPNQTPGPSVQELSKKDFILDLIAIYTIRLLGIEAEILRAYQGRLGITQATLDEIRSMEAQLTPGMTTIGTNEDGENVVVEHSEEWINKEKERFQSLFAWCKENLKVYPVESALDAKKQSEQPYYDILPQYSIHTLWAAEERDLILVSDDMMFRGLAFELHLTKGISVIEMLWLLLRYDFVSQEAFVTHLATLIARNYRYPFLDDTVLWKALEMDHFQNDFTFSKTVRALASDYLEERQAVISALSFFKKLVLNIPSSPQRDSIIAETLKWLVDGRNPKEILGILLGGIEYSGLFKLLPIQGKNLGNDIVRWGEEVYGI